MCAGWISFRPEPATAQTTAQTYGDRLAENSDSVLGVASGDDDIFVYGKLTYAGRRTLDETGPRFRILVGGGRYDAWMFGDARSTLGEALIGYQWIWDGYGAAGYVGAAIETHDTPDPFARKRGQRSGVALAAEAYRRISDDVLISAWASYRGPFEAVEFAAALQYELSERITLRGEVGYVEDMSSDGLRALGGAGVRVWKTWSVWALAGVEQDDDSSGFASRIEIVRRHGALPRQSNR